MKSDEIRGSNRNPIGDPITHELAQRCSAVRKVLLSVRAIRGTTHHLKGKFCLVIIAQEHINKFQWFVYESSGLAAT